jgi:hypothetical protein
MPWLPLKTETDYRLCHYCQPSPVASWSDVDIWVGRWLAGLFAESEAIIYDFGPDTFAACHDSDLQPLLCFLLLVCAYVPLQAAAASTLRNLAVNTDLQMHMFAAGALHHLLQTVSTCEEAGTKLAVVEAIRWGRGKGKREGESRAWTSIRAQTHKGCNSSNACLKICLESCQPFLKLLANSARGNACQWGYKRPGAGGSYTWLYLQSISISMAFSRCCSHLRTYSLLAGAA